MILILTGFFSGIISGMGIGGGTILIPALTLFMDIEQKTAQAINLFYFIPTAIVAVITHAKHKRIEKSIIKPLIITGIAGALLGTIAMNLISPYILRKAFGIFLFALGILEIKKGLKGQKKTSNKN
ncbi:MAG: sulfite exporter TauE/SafE family protein [Clostridia bacterium]|nr:sulfite exporter TauE/SafE family protein [Clostridia bacterium]